MCVALVADTHGFLDPRLAAVVRDCDLCAHGGDVGNRDVLVALAPRRGVVIAVRGNNDVAGKWPRADRALLDDLDDEATIDLPGGRLVAVHGDRWPARNRHTRLRRAFPDAGAVMYGHSHRLVCDRAERPWVLNPGAAGRVRTYGGPSCLILHAAADVWDVQVVRLAPLPRAQTNRAGRR